MKKKLLTTAILLVAAVALVVTTMLATVAYLTESAAVSNTFTVGNVSIEMFETPVKPDGTVADGFTPGSRKTADGNSYHLVPGMQYIKDPTIYIKANSEDCYIFVKARNQIRPIEDGNVVKDGEDGSTDALTMREQLQAKGWVALYKVNDDEIIYCYKGSSSDPDVYGTIVAASKEEQELDLFENFTVDPDAEVSRVGGAKVTLTAFAIQDEGLNITDYARGTKGYMCKLWNLVSGEFEFENVVIEDAYINGTDDTHKPN